MSFHPKRNQSSKSTRLGSVMQNMDRWASQTLQDSRIERQSRGRHRRCEENRRPSPFPTELLGNEATISRFFTSQKEGSLLVLYLAELFALIISGQEINSDVRYSRFSLICFGPSQRRPHITNAYNTFLSFSSASRTPPN